MELQEAFDSAKAKRLAAASKPARTTRSTPKKQKRAASKVASGQGESLDDVDGGFEDEDDLDVADGDGGGEKGGGTLDFTSIFTRLQGGSSVIEVATFDDSLSPEAIEHRTCR